MNEEEKGDRSAVAGQQTEVVVLAGGCFWSFEFEKARFTCR
jgi:hypothetical protein